METESKSAAARGVAAEPLGDHSRAYRRANLDCLIKEIVLYDDKIEIYFNSPIKISPGNSRGFTFYTEDIKITYKDPHRSELIKIQDMFEMKI